MDRARTRYQPSSTIPIASPPELDSLSEDAMQLFGDVSHAFQTPLTVLKSGIDLLQEDSTDTQKKVLKAMERSVEDLSHLTRNLLQLARIEAELPSDMETLDLSALLLQTVEYVQIICSHSHIILSHFIAKDVTVSGNKEQLREAITNILSNAVKYTAPCGLRKITVSLLAEAEQVILTIADTGVGISPDRVSYIFNRFYRERREGTVGTGLGLTIVKTIIEKHHGSIEVESSIGKGTCFIVRLPENS